MRRLTCVTTRYLPNLKHLIRWCEVNRCVILDLAPLPDRNRDSFINRNRISKPTSDLPIWLSVPIKRRRGLTVREVEVSPADHHWIKKHIRTIEQRYPQHKVKAPGFVEALADALRYHDGTLLSVNLNVMKVMFNTLNISYDKIMLESQITSFHDKQHRVYIAANQEADCYVAGEVEVELMKGNGEIDELKSRGIKVINGRDRTFYDRGINLVTCRSCVELICGYGIDFTRSMLPDETDSLPY